MITDLSQAIQRQELKLSDTYNYYRAEEEQVGACVLTLPHTHTHTRTHAHTQHPSLPHSHNPWGPGAFVLIPATRRSFPPGTCSEREHRC